ncbi:MAG: nucleotidyltransferase domain-containing protein [Clostridia bacterium]|nr:nucleotidyltransferase domain-containing protein [Clostridia bacterium]
MAGLDQVKDLDSAKNIEEITRCFVEQFSPLKVFLFGAFADGSYNDQSDYDFYIVVNDEADTWEIRNRAQRAIRNVQNRPVDIVVGTNSRFEKYGPSLDSLFVEGEVFRKGKLLYDQTGPILRRISA